VTPSHQYPLGVTMSIGRRLAMLDWARESGAWILEDDYDSEFRYSGRPLPALRSLDEAGRVLYAGSFSKVLLPSLRMRTIYRDRRAALQEAIAEVFAGRLEVDTHAAGMNMLARLPPGSDDRAAV